MSDRLRFKTARQLFDAFPDAGEDMSASPSDQPTLDFLGALVSGATPEDAVTFCSYMLPRRESVWWGYQCLSQLPDIMTPEDRQLMALAEDWVRRPDEEARFAALEAGMAAKTKTPGAWIALAAGWSGATMLRPAADQPQVATPPSLTAKATNAGVLGALARVDRKVRSAMLRSFVSMGVQLAQHQ